MNKQERLEKLKSRLKMVGTAAHLEKILASFGPDRAAAEIQAKEKIAELRQRQVIPPDRSAVIPADQATRAHIPPGTRLKIVGRKVVDG